MTKAHALKKFFKKYYNVELEGMSTTYVLRDMFKKVYGLEEVEGNSVIGVFMNVMKNNSSLSPIEPSDGGGDDDPSGGGATDNKVGTAKVGSAIVG